MSLKQKNSLKLNFLTFQPHLLIFKVFFFLIYRNSYSWGKGRLSSLGGRDRTRKPWCRTCISHGAGKRGEWSPQAPKYIFTWQLEMPGDWVWVAHITEYNMLSLAVLTAGGQAPKTNCPWLLLRCLFTAGDGQAPCKVLRVSSHKNYKSHSS